MRILSLFDGMSCGQLALKKAGIEVEQYYASEIDKHAISVTQKNFPETIQLGNVEQIEMPNNIDLLIGGSPCQGFSFAGKQLNFEDSRSKLFFEFVKKLEVLKPKYFLLENTPMKKEFQDVITKYLGVEPIMINSNLFSFQNRKRLYWTNIPIEKMPEERTGGVHNILEEKVDEKYYIENEKAFLVCEEEVIKNKIISMGLSKSRNPIYIIHDEEVELGLCGGEYCFPCLTPHRVKKRQNGQRFKPNNSKFYTLTAQDRHGVLIDGRMRHLTPLECERLQTVPDNYTYLDKMSDAQRYKMLGNGWTVDLISFIFEKIK